MRSSSPVPLATSSAVVPMEFQLVCVAPLGALLIVYLLCHQFFRQAHRSVWGQCLLLFGHFDFFFFLVVIICSEHMTPSILTAPYPLDLMVQWSLALLAMSILLYWMAFPSSSLTGTLVVPDTLAVCTVDSFHCVVCCHHCFSNATVDGYHPWA